MQWHFGIAADSDAIHSSTRWERRKEEVEVEEE